MTTYGTEEEVPGRLDDVIKNSIIPAGVPGGVSGRRGVSFVNDEPVVLAGYQSGGAISQIPPGYFVMARVLTSQRIDDMESTLQLPDITLRSYSPGDSTGLPGADDILKMKKGAILSQPVDNSQFEGTAIITGIEDKPTFLSLHVRDRSPGVPAGAIVNPDCCGGHYHPDCHFYHRRPVVITAFRPWAARHSSRSR